MNGSLKRGKLLWIWITGNFWRRSHFHEWHCGAVTNQGISVGLESHFGIPDNHLLAVPVNLAGMCLDSGQERVVCTKKTLVIHVTEQSTYLSECSRTMEPVTDLLRSNEKKNMLKTLIQYIATCCPAEWPEQNRNDNSRVSAIQNSPEPGRRTSKEAHGQPHRTAWGNPATTSHLLNGVHISKSLLKLNPWCCWSMVFVGGTFERESGLDKIQRLY